MNPPLPEGVVKDDWCIIIRSSYQYPKAYLPLIMTTINPFGLFFVTVIGELIICGSGSQNGGRIGVVYLRVRTCYQMIMWTVTTHFLSYQKYSISFYHVALHLPIKPCRCSKELSFELFTSAIPMFGWETFSHT